MTEEERVERFEAAYNRVDRALSRLIGRAPSDQRRTFAAKVRIASHRTGRLRRHRDFLEEIGHLRNALVHNRTGDDLFLAVPTERTVVELERVEARLSSPRLVTPMFAGEVISLSPEQPLQAAWEHVRQGGHSRYPVYDQDGFVGLLTSNGFARWCASQMEDGVLHVDAAAVRVADVLAHDHRRDQVAFVARDAPIDDVDDLFSHTKPLEVVIITEHGHRHERPLGLICAADLVGME